MTTPNIDSALAQIDACKTLDELRELWKSNAKSWRPIKGFNTLLTQKESRKRILEPVDNLLRSMLMFNQRLDAFNAAQTDAELGSAITELRSAARDVHAMVHDIVDGVSPLNPIGPEMLSALGVWYENRKYHTHFSLTERT